MKKNIIPSLADLDEGPLEFNPTYKYDIGTNNYDTSKKKRTPAWCDRILFKKSNNIEIVKYSNVPHYTNSDHKPVFGIFRVRVKRIKHEERMRIMRDIQENTDHQRTRDLSGKNNSNIAEIKDNFFEVGTKNVNLIDIGSPPQKMNDKILEDKFDLNTKDKEKEKKKGGFFNFMNFMK